MRQVLWAARGAKAFSPTPEHRRRSKPAPPARQDQLVRLDDRAASSTRSHAKRRSIAPGPTSLDCFIDCFRLRRPAMKADRLRHRQQSVDRNHGCAARLGRPSLTALTSTSLESTREGPAAQIRSVLGLRRPKPEATPAVNVVVDCRGTTSIRRFTRRATVHLQLAKPGVQQAQLGCVNRPLS